MTQIHWILASDPADSFPAVDQACEHPDGLLAAGGDLSTERLVYAYRHGIFPWFEEGQEILWWSPNPRMVIDPREIHISRSLKKELRQNKCRFSIDTAFSEVVEHCAGTRLRSDGTWITPHMLEAYNNLHRHGWAHSVEVWQEDQLVGGIYGVAIGRMFFGESMFSKTSNSSKMALIKLAKWLEKWNFALIDCQVKSAHLVTMGGVELERAHFVTILSEQCRYETPPEVWQKRPNLVI